MSIRNYRIIKDSNGYYPQILKSKKYLFGVITINEWLCIRKEVNSFGLYGYLDYPFKEIYLCEEAIVEYDRQFRFSKPERMTVIKYITSS